mgnify:CR=1 FL=1
MTQLVTALNGAEGSIAPLIDRLASELERSGVDNRPDSSDGGLLADLLEYAAAAEQQLADQRRRIAYLESLSMTDELTGLANRRGFERFLEQALCSARRHEESGVLGVLDLDGFKSLNDSLGHAAGDAALVEVAKLLKASVRSFDCAARLGGDEFAVVLVRCSPIAAMRRLQILRKSLEETTFPWQGRNFTLGASLGMQTFTGGGEVQDLLFEADRAMYQDKRTRRALPA